MVIGEQYSKARLEAACGRALQFDEVKYGSVKRILQQKLDDEPLPTPASAPPATTFVRSVEELLGHLWEGASA